MSLMWMVTLLANSGSCCEGEFEAGEVAGAGAVQGVAVPPGVQADEVEGDRCVDVFEVGFGQAAVAGLAGAGDGDGLMDGAFDTGAEAILGLPAGAGAARCGPAGGPRAGGGGAA